MKWDSSSGYLNFLRRLLIFSLILGIIATGFAILSPSKFITPVLPWLFVFFIGVTLAGFYLLLRSAKVKFIKFLNTYLLVTGVKLLLFIAVIFLYIFNNRQDAAAFAISFLVLYLCYMIFEVVSLVGYFKSLQQ